MLHRVVAGFVRRTWLVAIVTVVVCGGFALRAMDAYAAGRTAADDEAPRAAAVVAPPPVAPARIQLDGDVLVERNIFCSSCTRTAVPGLASAPSYSGQPALLIATSLGKAPRATVRVLATEAQGSWGLGETIPGVGRVTRIGGSSVDVVDASGHTGQLSLVEAKSGGPAGAAAATASSSAAAPTSPFADRIEKLTDTTYKVDRELVRELVMGTTQAKGVRALPVIKNGEVAGLRLTGIKPDSIAAAVGIKSGDVFDAIDGVKIKSAQQLLDLFTKLDSVAAVELSGTRAQKPLALQFQLR